jgi:hypothetical protein
MLTFDDAEVGDPTVPCSFHLSPDVLGCGAVTQQTREETSREGSFMCR